MSPKPTIVFMGTPSFALESLSALYETDYPLLAVFSQPDKPAGRNQELSSPPCADFARAHQISLYQPAKIKNNPEVVKILSELKPDILVVAAYGKILPDEILALPKIASVNVHASLLPRYRGAAPINWALLEGEKETGVCLMKMASGLDAGPVYAEKKIPIEPRETTASLTPKLAKLGAQLLVEKIPELAQGKLNALKQDENLVTLAPPLKKEMGHIQWSQPAATIDRQIRAFNPWPGTYTLIDNKRLKIYDGFVLDEKPSAPAGTVYFLSPQGMSIACGTGALCITEVQLEGKKRMPASEFVKGYRLQVGEKL